MDLDISDLECYAIHVEGHKDAENYLPLLLKNAKEYSWTITPFLGVDGRKHNLNDYGIKIDTRHKKVKRQMEKLGVQGCFLSHYNLWKKSIDLNQTIGIFEFDVRFKAAPPNKISTDVLKLAGFKPAKIVPTGQWWGGAYAYILTPIGAKKLIDWTHQYGASPADFMLADGVLNVGFDVDNRVELNSQGTSTTENW